MLSNPFQRMSAGRLFFVLGLFSGAVVTAVVNLATAEPSASPERAAAAIGHYARSRALLAEALAEFEEGRKLARPDLLLDPEEWRISIISRAEELNRVLDPQPRVTRSGARFEATPQLIRKEGEKPKAAISIPKAKPEKKPAPKPVVAKALPAPKKPIAEIITAGPTSEPKTAPAEPAQPAADPIKVEPPAPAAEPAALPTASEPPAAYTQTIENPTAAPVETPPEPAAGTVQEDPEIAEAINKAIKERLDRMSREGAPEGEAGK